jgi:hypothetical protein
MSLKRTSFAIQQTLPKTSPNLDFSSLKNITTSVFSSTSCINNLPQESQQMSLCKISKVWSEPISSLSTEKKNCEFAVFVLRNYNFNCV